MAEDKLSPELYKYLFQELFSKPEGNFSLEELLKNAPNEQVKKELNDLIKKKELDSDVMKDLQSALRDFFKELLNMADDKNKDK